MELLTLSFREAVRNIKKSFLSYIFITLILSVSVVLFVSSTDFVINIGSTELNYSSPNELSFIHLRNKNKNNMEEIQTSNEEVKLFIKEQKLVTLSYLMIDHKNVSWRQNIKEKKRIDLVSPNFFENLGVKPYLGKHPNPRKNEVALSYAFWKSVFYQKDALLKKILINGVQYTITGVMPKYFFSPLSNKYKQIFNSKVNIWIPLKNEDMFFNSKTKKPTILFGRSKNTILDQEKAFNKLISKIRPKQKIEQLIIEVKELKKYILGQDYKKAKKVLYFAIFLFILSLGSIFLLLSAKISKYKNQIVYKKVFGANGWKAAQTQSVEYGIIIFIVLIISLFTRDIVRTWLSKLNLVSSFTYTKPNNLMITIFIILILGLVYISIVVLPLYKTRNKNLSSLLGNKSLLTNKKGMFLQKALLYTQSFFSMSLIIVSLSLINETYLNYSNVSKVNYKNIYAIELEFKEGLNSIEKLRRLKEIKIEIKKRYNKVVILTASPVNLIGELIYIRKPVSDLSSFGVLSVKNGISEIMIKDSVQENKNKPFGLSIVYTEPEYFKLLGINFLEGSVFKKNENNKVIITKSSKENIFINDGSKNYINKIIPADMTLGVWKVGLKLSGIIGNINLHEGEEKTIFLKGFNVVFKLLSEQNLSKTNFNRATMLIKVEDNVNEESLLEYFSNYNNVFILKRHYLLEKKIKEIIFNSSIKSISASIIAIISIIIVLLGTWGVVDLICIKYRKETGTRLALGASKGIIYKFFLLNNVLPSVYGVTSSAIVFLAINTMLNLQLFSTYLLFISCLLLLFFITLVNILSIKNLLSKPISLILNQSKE